MTNRNDSLTELGTIKIHRDSIASIAAIASTEIEGVKCIGKNFRSGLWELVGKKDYSAIRVEFDKNGEVCLEIPLVVKYNFSIPDVATKVQENVRNSLEKMTNIIIKDIGINVQAIEKG
ncbi:MAG: Asp23/Gls24 family envelope stress response protein [Candidatus Omnitrophica bacterium]|nr:Asp23/Gls24 family envelope stress response protein [Candidatus Omnitrophota bacterium]